MTDLIYDYITMGVDMMISGAILASVVILLRSSTILSAYSAQQQATTDRINYYKEFSMYDCTDKLLSPDVLSAMVYYKYDLDVVIQIGSDIYTNDRRTGKYYKNGTQVLTYEQLSTAVGTQLKFKAYLVEDFKKSGTEPAISSSGYMGGVITGLKFVYTP